MPSGIRSGIFSGVIPCISSDILNGVRAVRAQTGLELSDRYAGPD